ncbi:MAG: hypothetical protein AB7G54_00550 [Methyloceanibacter sp.]
MFSICDERPPLWLNFEAGLASPGGSVPGDGIAHIVSQTIPHDMVVFGLLAEGMDSDGNDSLQWGINFRSSRQQDWWFQTRPQSIGFAPVLLVAGSTGEPFIWPEPRLLRRGEEIQLHIKRKANTGLCYVRVSLLGARLKVDARGRVRDELAEYDREDRGYAALIVESSDIETSGTTCVPGPAITDYFHLGSLKYDFVFSQASLIVRDPNESTLWTPLTGVRGELQIRDSGRSHSLSVGQSWIPWSFFGGQTQEAGQQETALRSVASEIGASWRIRQDAGFELSARVVKAGVSPVRLMLALHGRRDSLQGRVATLDEMSADDCPPDPRAAMLERAYPFGGY